MKAEVLCILGTCSGTEEAIWENTYRHLQRGLGPAYRQGNCAKLSKEWQEADQFPELTYDVVTTERFHLGGSYCTKNLSGYANIIYLSFHHVVVIKRYLGKQTCYFSVLNVSLTSQKVQLFIRKTHTHLPLLTTKSMLLFYSWHKLGLGEQMKKKKCPRSCPQNFLISREKQCLN